jgi:hypothetical protein
MNPLRLPTNYLFSPVGIPYPLQNALSGLVWGGGGEDAMPLLQKIL